MEFKIVRDDITNMKVDAIVLPANTRLAEGSGTSKAIFEKAGKKELREACKKLGKVDEGKVGVTLGFALDATYIIHAVVPKWRGGNNNECETLRSAYLSSLEAADIRKCSSIAIPLLASGNNGFDKQLAFEIAKETIEIYEVEETLSQVFLVIYSPETCKIVKKLGFSVEENIDDLYVVSNDESFNHVSEAFVNARTYLNDEKNQEVIKETAKAAGVIVEQVVEQGIEIATRIKSNKVD